MKKLVIAVATVCAVAASAVSVALASSDSGTVVARGFSCAILDGNGSVFVTTNSVLTAYQNRAVLQCEGYGAPAPFLIHWHYPNTGLSCGMLQYGSTNTWDDKVGRNGNSQLHLLGAARRQRRR